MSKIIIALFACIAVAFATISEEKIGEKFFFNTWIPLPNIPTLPPAGGSAGTACTTTAATAPCICGTNTCQVGQICSAALTCTAGAPVAACPAAPNKATAACKCGSATCNVGQTCGPTLACA